MNRTQSVTRIALLPSVLEENLLVMGGTGFFVARVTHKQHLAFLALKNWGLFWGRHKCVWVDKFLSKMFDVGDLPVLTFGNCVMCINDLVD